MKVVQQHNCYKILQYPSYAEFIRKILNLNIKITYIIIVIYVCLWFGIINGPYNLDWYLFLIMFAISLLPLMYAIYSIVLQKLIIDISKRNDIVNFEKNHIKKTYLNVLNNPTQDNINEYKRLIEFRDYLVCSKNKEATPMQIELIISIATALIPVICQAVSAYLFG